MILDSRTVLLPRERAGLSLFAAQSVEIEYIDLLFLCHPYWYYPQVYVHSVDRNLCPMAHTDWPKEQLVCPFG